MAGTLKDVAEHAGVSTATVSRVLSGTGYVSEEMKSRVLAAVETLNYQLNGIARSLRSARTQVIGVLVPDIANPYYMALVRGLESKMYEWGYNILLASSDENDVKEAQLLKVFLGKRVDGLVMSPASTNSTAAVEFINQNVPIVTVDRLLKSLEVDAVVEENENSAFQLVRHLIEQGHQRIGMVNGDLGNSVACERQAGYERALRHFGIQTQPGLILNGKFDQATGHTFVTQFLMREEELPSAIFCGNNFIAMGALIAARERGVQIPSAMSLVSFGEPLMPELIQPRLTAVIQDPWKVGDLAAELLKGRIRGEAKGQARKLVLPTHIRFGESVQKLSLT